LSILHSFGLTFDDFEEGYLLCSLEDLDDNGRTVRDPQAVDEDGNIITGLTKSKDFPFPGGKLNWDCFQKKSYRSKVDEIKKKLTSGEIAYLTPQEKHLIGLTPSDKYEGGLYMPMYLQDNGLEHLKHVKKHREGLGFSILSASFTDLNPEQVKSVFILLCSLESLDKHGRTTRDPQIVDENNSLIPGVGKSKNCKYWRPE